MKNFEPIQIQNIVFDEIRKKDILTVFKIIDENFEKIWSKKDQKLSSDFRKEGGVLRFYFYRLCDEKAFNKVCQYFYRRYASDARVAIMVLAKMAYYAEDENLCKPSFSQFLQNSTVETYQKCISKPAFIFNDFF